MPVCGNKNHLTFVHTGQSSSSTGEIAGAMASEMADIGWGIASQKSPSVSPNLTSASSAQTRHMSTFSHHSRPVMSTLVRPMSTSAGQANAGRLLFWVFWTVV